MILESVILSSKNLILLIIIKIIKIKDNTVYITKYNPGTIIHLGGDSHYKCRERELDIVTFLCQ